MRDYLDISLRLADPLDEFRLFEVPGDGPPLRALYERVRPQAGNGRCVLAPPTYYDLADGAGSMRAINDFVLAEGRRPEVAAVFAVVEPKYEGHAEAELERLSASGAKGVVWSGRAQGVFVNDALIASLCAKAYGLGLLSMFRTEPYSTNEALWRIVALARQCPDVPVIVSGALQSYDNAQLVASMLDGLGNVYFDTAAWSRSTGFLGFAARLAEQERLVFGSGGLTPADAAAESLAGALRAAGLSDTSLDGVMRTVALGLLRPEGSAA